MLEDSPTYRTVVVETKVSHHYDVSLTCSKIKVPKTILSSTSEADPDKNEKTQAELVLLLDETSLSIIKNDAKDKGRISAERL